MSTTDTREARLPRWAQDELRALRSRIAALEANQERTVEETNTYADDLYGQVPLRPGVRVRFVLPEITTPEGVTLRWPPYIEARVRDGFVDVHSDNLLSVRPQAANHLEIHVVPR